MIDSLRYRLFWLKYGILIGRSSKFEIKKIRINGKSVDLKFPEGEEEVLLYELRSIIYDDCYGLRSLREEVNTIVDVGANIGLFSLAARDVFPKAEIFCYEPNPKIQSILRNNLGKLTVNISDEAVGIEDGMVEIDNTGGSLFSKTKSSRSGSIKKSAFRKIIERAGGRIDLLKLDCEGAEWELFEDTEGFRKIQNIVMEYHLWAKPKASIIDVMTVMKELGFRITNLHESEKLQWGILQATKI
ncbi:MAG: FkbM family methyltransferase [Puniceicoccaceae bacterium]